MSVTLLKYLLTKLKQNNMKKMLSFFFGIIILPLIGLGVFSFINWVLAITFNGSFIEIQQSPVWLFWSMLIIIFVVYYFTEVDRD